MSSSWETYMEDATMPVRFVGDATDSLEPRQEVIPDASDGSPGRLLQRVDAAERCHAPMGCCAAETTLRLDDEDARGRTGVTSSHSGTYSGCSATNDDNIVRIRILNGMYTAHGGESN